MIAMEQIESRFEVFTGEEIDEAFLEKLMDVDRAVYDPRYAGSFDNMLGRFRAEKRSFVGIKEKGSNDPAGHINFFPINDELWDDITESGTVVRDDDIRPDELVPFGSADDKGYKLFVLSIDILPEFRDVKDAVITMSEGFRQYLLKLNREGHRILALSAAAISDDGKKFLSDRFFYFKREVRGYCWDPADERKADSRAYEDVDYVYVCDGEYLKLFLSGKLNRDARKREI